jgi:serine/threonine protein kinase/tetratricopeptide (TPR) repeat protein
MNSDRWAPRGDQWDRISGLFEAVLSVPSEERAAFLDQTCGGELTLREELESLVAAHVGAPQFLDQFYSDVVHPALAHADPDEASAAADVAVEMQPGQQIRHFTVHERLGIGGSGVVYRGRDALLERDVAIKFLAPRLSQDPAARARLVREAQAASRLEDPHVCAIHAVEPTADGGLCIVMAYCVGGTLRDRLRQGPIPSEQIAAIVPQLARGLACAHRAGIVHGDIKPANVGFAEGDLVRLLDFGVAVHAHEDASGRRGLSGTLPYLAPELWRGGTPDPRTDVWALGVTLFETVTGRRPFAGADPGALADAICAATLPPIVRPDGTAIRPELEQLIRCMLCADPSERPADGGAVVSALGAWLPAAHQGAADAPRSAPTVRTPAATPSATVLSRGPRIVVALVSALLAVAAWRVLSSPRSSVAPPPALEVARSSEPLSSLAVLPFTTRGRREIDYLANGMVDLLTPAFDGTGLVRGIDPNTVIGAAGAPPAGTVDSAEAQRIAASVRADRYVVGSVVGSGTTLVFRATLRRSDGREVGRAQATVADSNGLASGIDALVRQLIATELSAPGDTIAGIAAATTTSTRALRAYLDGERELRDARPAAAVAQFRDAVAADSTFALAWYRLARAARWNEVDSLSAAAAQRANRLAESLPPRQQALVRAYHTARFGSALQAERQLAQIVADYPTDVEAWMLLGELQFGNNPYHGRPLDDAAAAFQRVMALDPRNREVTVYLMDLAANADRLGQLDTLFSMYFSPNSAGEQPGVRATYIALHQRRLRANAPRRDTPAVTVDPSVARVALQRVGTDPRDRAAAREYAGSMATVPAFRVDGLLALTALDLADGKLERAEAHFRALTLLAPDVATEQRALFAVAPSARTSPDSLRALRRALLARREGGIAIDDALSTIEHEDLRHYLAGILSVRVGDSIAVVTARNALARHSAAGSRVAAPLSAALAGHWLLRSGLFDPALAAFERSDVDLPARVRRQHPVLAQHLDRLARAETLERLGRQPDAMRWYRSLREGAGVLGAPFVTAADAGAGRTRPVR